MKIKYLGPGIKQGQTGTGKDKALLGKGCFLTFFFFLFFLIILFFLNPPFLDLQHRNTRPSERQSSVGPSSIS